MLKNSSSTKWPCGCAWHVVDSFRSGGNGHGSCIRWMSCVARSNSARKNLAPFQSKRLTCHCHCLVSDCFGPREVWGSMNKMTTLRESLLFLWPPELGILQQLRDQGWCIFLDEEPQRNHRERKMWADRGFVSCLESATADPSAVCVLVQKSKSACLLEDPSVANVQSWRVNVDNF